MASRKRSTPLADVTVALEDNTIKRPCASADPSSYTLVRCSDPRVLPLLRFQYITAVVEHVHVNCAATIYAEELFALQPEATPATGSLYGKTWVAQNRRTLQFSQPSAVEAYLYNGSTATGMRGFDSCPALAHLRLLTAELTGVDYNFALVTFYSGGQAKLGWHSDNEAQIDQRWPIASWSFSSAPRAFDIRAKTQPEHKQRFMLASGDLLVMGGKDCQALTQHCVPAQLRLGEQFVRVNVTFRMLRSSGGTAEKK